MQRYNYCIYLCLLLFVYNSYISAHQDYELEAQFRALFLKITSSNLNYAVQALPVPVTTPKWHIFTLTPTYHFDWDLCAGITIKESDIKLWANWERATSEAHDHRTVPDQDMIGPLFEIGTNILIIKKAAGAVSNKYNALHMTAGQNFEYCNRLTYNIFVGIEYANIKQTRCNFFATSANAPSNESATFSIEMPYCFSGAGPEWGFDFNYNICENFDFGGYVTMAMLMGGAHTHSIYKTTSAALVNYDITSPNIQTTIVDKSTIVVPHLRERLAMRYSYCYNDYIAAIELGFEMQWYNNAIQTLDIASEELITPTQPDITGIYAATFQKNTSNFSLAGPYFSVSIYF